MSQNNHTDQAPSRGLIILYASVLLLSLNGLFARSIELDSTSITQIRSVVAFFTLLMILLLQKQKLRLPSLSHAYKIYALGVVMGLHWITFFQAMQVSSVAVGILALYSYPVFTVLLEPLFQKRRPQKADLIAALAMFGGVVLMLQGKLSGVETSSVSAGVFWGVLSALLFATRNVTQKYLLHEIPSSQLMFHQVIIIALMLLVFADWPRVANMAAVNWLLLLLLGVFCTATAHTLLSMSLKRLPAKSVALIGCLQPLLASVFAWLILGEIPGLFIIIGGAVIISVAAYESLQHRCIKGH